MVDWDGIGFTRAGLAVLDRRRRSWIGLLSPALARRRGCATPHRDRCDSSVSWAWPRDDAGPQPADAKLPGPGRPGLGCPSSIAICRHTHTLWLRVVVEVVSVMRVVVVVTASLPCPGPFFTLRDWGANAHPQTRWPGHEARRMWVRRRWHHSPTVSPNLGCAVGVERSVLDTLCTGLCLFWSPAARVSCASD